MAAKAIRPVERSIRMAEKRSIPARAAVSVVIHNRDAVTALEKKRTFGHREGFGGAGGTRSLSVPTAFPARYMPGEKIAAPGD